MKVGVLLLFFLIFAKGFGNHNVVVNKSRNGTTTDSTQIWLRLARKNTNLNTNQKKTLLRKAIEETKKNNPSSLHKISSAALASGDSILFKAISKEILETSKNLNQKKSHGITHWDIAYFYKKSRPDSAFYHFQEAYTLFSNIELDSLNLHYPGALLIDIGNLKVGIKDYIGAEKDIIKSIEYYNQVGQKNRQFGAYNALGIAQNGLQKFDKALEYHEKAKGYIRLGPEKKQYGFELMNQNNIASTYWKKGDFIKAFELYSNLQEKDSLLLKNPELYAKVLTSKAFCGFKSGLQNFEAYKRAYEQSNSILDSIGEYYAKARNYEYYAQIAAASKDTLDAIANAITAKTIAEETNNHDRLLSSLRLLSTLDKKNSNTYSSAYFKLNDEIQRKERTIQDKFARIRMETDEVIEENASLTKQKELYAGLALALVVVALGVFTIISQRISNQKLRFSKKQQESNQEIYELMLSQHGKLEEGKKSEQKRISEEMHDGILGQMLGIRLILSGLNERSDEEAIQQRAALIDKLQELEEEVRTISHELNSSAYDKVDNFISSLKELLKTVQASSGITIDFKYDKGLIWDKLDSDLKINVYRIIQEALQNCVKHAACKNIVVSFFNSEKMLNLTITDDGVGFNMTKGKKGIGLKNVESRVKKLNGSLKVDSTLNQGTSLKVSIPFSTESFISTSIRNARTSQKV